MCDLTREGMRSLNRDIIVIGASAGGVQALQRLAGALPADLPAAIFVVLHIWPSSESFLPAILARSGPLRVVEATDGAPIEPGTIYVAPSDLHLMIEADRVLVNRGPKENRTRPAINPLFRSAAASYRNRVIGVILSGTLDDGSAGLWAIKQCGGISVVQSDAAFDQMPRNAVENVEVDYHIPLEQIGPLLNRLSREAIAKDGRPVPEVVHISNEGAKMKISGFRLDEVGKRSALSCPDCGGALWEVEEGVLQYRCHVGHGYSAEALQAAENVAIEEALWSAARALKESAAVDERLAKRSAQHSLDIAAAAHQQNAKAKYEQVEKLQNFLASVRATMKPIG
jgi:two-component system, chemotaxis family, protein-glutamate methylesterase/glutaminase